MDVSKIDINIIERFSSCYDIAKGTFYVEPVDASAKMQKKIRKWLDRCYIGVESYPAEVTQYIDKKVSDKDFFEFLKLCNNHIQLKGTQKKQMFDKYSADLPEEVKAAIWTLLEENFYLGEIRRVGTNAQIDVGYNASYNRTLTLVNADGLPEENIDCLNFLNGSLIKENDEYILNGEAENYDDDSTTPFSIRFTDAKVDITLFRASEQLFWETPWTYLTSIAGDILSKHLLLPGDYLNNKEKELLPLITELSAISYSYIPYEANPADFSQLKSYIVRFGFNELLPLFESLEKNSSDNKKKNRFVEKLHSKLNTRKYEPLWRELYNTLVETQAEYPTWSTAYCPTELLNETRSNIQKLMESHGYSGTYPDFIKKGTTRGIHLAESYGTNYFVGAKKNAVYHIHCVEDYIGDHLLVKFLCGTEILRKGETARDIYSCMFNAKGRRFFKTVSYESDYINYDGECESQDLEQRVQIAVKKAELIKLTKEEREEVYDGLSLWQTILVSLAFVVICSLLFSILMTIGFMLLGILLCLILAMPQAIPSMFSELPWLELFLSAFGLSCVVLGILLIFSLRK